MREKQQRELEGMEILHGITTGREKVSIDGTMFQVTGIDVTRTPRFSEAFSVDGYHLGERAVYDVYTQASITLRSLTPVDSPNGFADLNISGDVAFVSKLLKSVLVK